MMKVYDAGHTVMIVGKVTTADAVQTTDPNRWVAGARDEAGHYHKVYGTKREVMLWMRQVAETGDVTTELEHDVMS